MNPSITIITAVFNGSSTISDCLKSINSQTVSVEHIIIDGVSTDNTLEIIKETSPHTHIVSEPDNGIYDAMNKGIRLATGDIVGILNADDFYADPLVLETVINAFVDQEIDACYSDLVYVDQEKTDKIVRYWKTCPYRSGLFEKGWVPPHPTFFVRREVYEQLGLFDLDYQIAADFELMARFIDSHKIRTIYLPQVTVHMRLGGTTNKSIRNIIKQNIEIIRALKKNKLRVSALFPVYKLIDKFSQYFKSPTP
ncbi:MAG: glycosyltransferase family 2 protein [Desulfuromonadaceae bacterium]|nr:glycosyltransferase family 2 protein [Desulfuromonadaceae bacterium]